MIKTGDNLKQEQFAMQMINQFNIIFNKEETGLYLRPYEVISIGPDAGIMEMVTDSCSLGRVMKIMAREKIKNFKQFFKSYFKDNYKAAQKNFCKSLAAYCVVTYFLQIKDRHN
jgi:phosphatidylinositol 4-kinase